MANMAPESKFVGAKPKAKAARPAGAGPAKPSGKVPPALQQLMQALSGSGKTAASRAMGK